MERSTFPRRKLVHLAPGVLCHWVTLLALSAVVVTAPGCGPSGTTNATAQVQGEITLNGEPLPDDVEGNIVFRPVGSNQAPMATAKIQDGKYNSPKTPLGPVKVFIDLQQPTGRTVTSERTPEPYVEMENIVPAKYGSGIETEITGDEDNLNFDLEE